MAVRVVSQRNERAVRIGDPRHHLRPGEKRRLFPEDYVPVKVRCTTSPYLHCSQVPCRHLYAAAVTRLNIRIQLFRIIYCIYIGYWYIVMCAVCRFVKSE